MKKERSHRKNPLRSDSVRESIDAQEYSAHAGQGRKKGGAMKRILKKNQIVITALVIMVVAAGYLEMNRKEAANSPDQAVETDGQSLLDLSAEDVGKDEDAPGEALLVNANGSSGVFASVKLEREQTRAKNKEDLLQVIDNESLSEKEKSLAVETMVTLTANSELENATELLLQANGYSDVVVSIVDQSADIVVATQGLTQEQAAQIMDIVKRKTEFSPENIVITPVDPSGA